MKEEAVSDTPFVSVVVISKDRHDLLVQAVASLRRSDYPEDRFEIVVVEEGDAPTPVEGARYVFLPRRDLGLGFARNTGVRNARGNPVLFTDDDCLVEPTWVRRMVAAFADPGVVGVAGATFAQPGSAIGLCEDVLGFPGGGHRRYHQYRGQPGETRLLSGCNCAYRRALLEEVGFREDGYGRLGADDYLMGLRAAERGVCRYLPDAVVYHKPRASLRRIVDWFARRKVNELLFAETEAGRKSYRFLWRAPHRVVAFRLAGAVAVVVAGGAPGAALVAVAMAAWYAVIWARSWPVTRYVGSRWVSFLVPVVRAAMETGVLVAEWRYLRRSHAELGSTLQEYRR